MYCVHVFKAVYVEGSRHSILNFEESSILDRFFSIENYILLYLNCQIEWTLILWISSCSALEDGPQKDCQKVTRTVIEKFFVAVLISPASPYWWTTLR